MIRYALPLLLLIPMTASGDCRVRKRAVVVEEVVTVTPVAAVQYVPVAVPLYSVTYAPGHNDAEVQALKQRIIDLEQQLKIRREPAPQPKEETQAPAVPKLYTRSCLQCHQQGKIAAGKITLADAKGALIPLSAEQKLEILRRIDLEPKDKDVMPPAKSGHELATDPEAAELKGHLTQRGAKK